MFPPNYWPGKPFQRISTMRQWMQKQNSVSYLMFCFSFYWLEFSKQIEMINGPELGSWKVGKQ